MISCIKSGGTITEVEQIRNKDAVKSFKKIAIDSNALISGKFIPVKFGYLDEKRHLELYICFEFDESSTVDTSQFDGVKAIDLAQQYAKTKF